MKVVTAKDGEMKWRYDSPEDTTAKMLLLQKHGVATIGCWGKGLGLIGWCPLPRRDKVIEESLPHYKKLWFDD